MLEQAYGHTLQLRSQILSVMCDMVDFGPAKRAIAKALGSAFSQTENKHLVRLVIPEPLPARKELTGALKNHWVQKIHEAIAQEAETGIPRFEKPLCSSGSMRPGAPTMPRSGTPPTGPSM